MSEKNTSALQNTSALSSDPPQSDPVEVVELETYRKGKDVKGFDETAQDNLQPPSEQAHLPTHSVAERKAEEATDSSLTIDDHLSHALVNLEMELSIAREVKRDLETSKDRISQLNEQLQEAKRETEGARSELDALHLEEARARAELEVTQTEQLRIETEIQQTQPLIEQLQQQVKQAKAELHESNEKLDAAKAVRDKEGGEIEKARQALYTTVALETQILAEIESARLSAERYRCQTQEIQARLKALQGQLDEVRSTARQAQESLQDARISEAKMDTKISPRLSSELGSINETHLDDEEKSTLPQSERGLTDQTHGPAPVSQETEGEGEATVHRPSQSPSMKSKGAAFPVEAEQTVVSKMSAVSSVDSNSSTEAAKLIKKPYLQEDLEKPLPTTSFTSANSEQPLSETTEQTRESDGSSEDRGIHSANADRLSDHPHHKSDNTGSSSSIAEMVYNLADAGHQIDEISRVTHIAQGQVELLLKMRNLKLTT